MIQAALILLSAVVILIIARTQFNKSGSRQLEQLAALLEKTKNNPGNNSQAAKNLQNQIYVLIDKELNKDDHKILYQAIDLLKLYLGEGLGQPDDPARITKIISQAMRANQTDVLGYAIHAFCPLIRKAPAERIPQAVEQLCIIAAVAMKKHKNFLTARAIEIILEGLERMERAFAKGLSPADMQAGAAETGAKSVKLVGLAILRGGDIALFREFCVKINEFITGGKDGIFAGMWPPVFAAWLNYLARKENEEAFTILLAHIISLTDGNTFPPFPQPGTAEDRNAKTLEVLIGECRHMIVVSSLNPYNTFAAPMLSFFLSAAFRMKNTNIWRQAASCAQETTQTALARHGAKDAFPAIYPFLEIGRKMLLENLKSAKENEGDSYRSLFSQEAFAALAREWMKTFEYEARKSFILTVPEVVLQIREHWLAYPAAEGSEKSLNKFCHFLIVYWARLRPKIASRTPLPPEMDFRGRLTEEEIKKLELFLF